MRTMTFITIAIFSLFLHGCSFMPAPDDDTKDWSARKLYTDAKSSLDTGEYENAIKSYELLESRYPFGRFAKQGQIEIAYAYYKFDEPESAIAAANRFIKLHPNHPHVDYAYYLKGLIYFSRDIGFLGRVFQQDTSSRDTSSGKLAFSEFTTLVKRFPQSKYAPESRLRALYLRNSLAQHEIHVASYYITRKAYVAAVNRCKYVIQNFDQSHALPDALKIMAIAYDKLELPVLAADARRVLQTSYPDYVKQKSKQSWWNPF